MPASAADILRGLSFESGREMTFNAISDRYAVPGGCQPYTDDDFEYANTGWVRKGFVYERENI